MGADGACHLLFCAAQRSGEFPPNTPAGLREWSGETTEGLASPSDCPKSARIVSDEDVL
jgi:hypothetical protein